MEKEIQKIEIISLCSDLARYSTLAIGIVYFVFACLAPILIERVGRRSLSLFQLITCDIALILLTIFTALQYYSTVYATSISIQRILPSMTECILWNCADYGKMLTVEVLVTMF